MTSPSCTRSSSLRFFVSQDQNLKNSNPQLPLFPSKHSYITHSFPSPPPPFQRENRSPFFTLLLLNPLPISFPQAAKPPRFPFPALIYLHPFKPPPSKPPPSNPPPSKPPSSLFPYSSIPLPLLHSSFSFSSSFLPSPTPQHPLPLFSSYPGPVSAPPTA